MRSKIITLIHQAAEESHEKLDDQMQNTGVTIRLFGPSGILDSIGLVNLVVAAESAIEDEFGVSVALADDRAMSQKNSPFRTVSALADYIMMILEEENVTVS
jgi:acyl carrier protein